MSSYYPPLDIEGERALRLARRRASLLGRRLATSVDLLVALEYEPATKRLLAGVEVNPLRVRAIVRTLASDDRPAIGDMSALEVVRRAASLAAANGLTAIDPISLLSGIMVSTRSTARRALLELGVSESQLAATIALSRANRWGNPRAPHWE